MSYLEFSVPGRVVPQGGMKAINVGGKPRVMHQKTRELMDYRARIAIAARDAGAEIVDGPIELYVMFFFDRPKLHFGTGRNAEVLKPSAPRYPVGRPDIDKCLRSVLDALTQICFHDDSQVVAVNASKHYVDAGVGPETVIEVERLNDGKEHVSG